MDKVALRLRQDSLSRLGHALVGSEDGWMLSDTGRSHLGLFGLGVDLEAKA